VWLSCACAMGSWCPPPPPLHGVLTMAPLLKVHASRPAAWRPGDLDSPRPLSFLACRPGRLPHTLYMYMLASFLHGWPGCLKVSDGCVWRSVSHTDVPQSGGQAESLWSHAYGSEIWGRFAGVFPIYGT